MKSTKASIFLGALCASALIICLAPAAGMADDDVPLNMTANAGARTTGGTSIVQISVSEWTTPEERQMLIDYVKAEGSLHLDDKLQSLSNKGRVNRAGEMGINWRYAYRFAKDGGSTIVLATNRPVSLREASGQGVVGKAYNITLAIIELDEEGMGAGTLMIGAELGFGADGKLEIGNVGQNAIHLGSVRVLGKKKKK